MGALQPALDVLAVGRVGRTDQRNHVERTGPAASKRCKALPRVVAERLLEMTRDDRSRRARHTVAHVRDLRTLFAVARSPGSLRRRDASATPPPRPGPGLDGGLRRLRSRASAPSGARPRARLSAG